MIGTHWVFFTKEYIQAHLQPLDDKKSPNQGLQLATLGPEKSTSIHQDGIKVRDREIPIGLVRTCIDKDSVMIIKSEKCTLKGLFFNWKWKTKSYSVVHIQMSTTYCFSSVCGFGTPTGLVYSFFLSTKLALHVKN